MKKGCMFVFAIPSGGKTSSLATSLLSESKAPLCPTPQSLPQGYPAQWSREWLTPERALDEVESYHVLKNIWVLELKCVWRPRTNGIN